MDGSALRRLGAVVGSAALLAALLGTVSGPATVLAASDPGCTDLGGSDGAGTCFVTLPKTVTPTAVTLNEHLHLQNGAVLTLGGASLTLSVNPGNLEMDGGSSIVGPGKAITINVPHGDMTMHNGAVITTTVTAAGGAAGPININVGNYPATPPAGAFTMDPGSKIEANGGSSGVGGDIKIMAGKSGEIDGQVLSQVNSGSSGGTGRDGGSIFVDTGCGLDISPTGLLSSRGQDQGADLVHLSSCEVTIEGTLESTGAGHGIPNPPNLNHCDNTFRPDKHANSTGCVEVWGDNITIKSTATINADLNANCGQASGGGPDGESWIDLIAHNRIIATGRTSAGATFLAHADTCSGTDTTPNTITAKAVGDTFTGSGNLFSAAIIGMANGSSGGTVNIQAQGTVTLDTSTVVAAGDNIGGGSTSPPPCDGGSGACGAGGVINIRSFQANVTWQNGVGNVNPDNQPSPNAGTVNIQACFSVNTTGTSFGNAVPAVVAASLTGPGSLNGAGGCSGQPSVQSYVTSFFTQGIPIWAACGAVPGQESHITTVIHAGHGVDDTATAAGITSATIYSYVHDKATVTGTGGLTPTGNVTFTWFSTPHCTTGTGTDAWTVDLVGGVAHPSKDEQVPVGGGSFLATYNGDETYNPSTSECEPLQPVKLTPGIVTAIHAGATDSGSPTVITSAAPGATVHDSATVTGTAAGGMPAGTVTFTWFSGTNCLPAPGTSKGTINLNASGIADPSQSQVVPSGGGSFRATYNGSDIYNSATSDCEPLQAVKLTARIVTAIHAGATDSGSPTVITSAAPGVTVHDSATVTGTAAGGTPAGTVTFTWFSGTNCSPAPGTSKGTITLNASGIADPSQSQVVPSGGGSFRATYNGSTIYNSATSDCEPLTTSGITLGLTPGFWQNKNGNKVITDKYLLPVLLGINAAGQRSTNVTNLTQSNTIIQSVNGCAVTWTIQCTGSGGGFSSTLKQNTFEQLARQTLALKYNMGYLGSGFSNQTLSSLGIAITPTLSSLGLTGSSNVGDVFTKGQQLIGSSGPGGTTTQTQASAIIDLMTAIDSV